MVGLPILSNEDIDDFFKGNPSYLGTFSKDQVAKVKISKKIDSFAIMNMENEKDGEGTHWVAMYNSIVDPQSVYYFDSYGVPPPEEVIAWLKQTKKEIVYSTTQMQNLVSTSCGWFCLAFLFSCQLGDDFLTFTNLFHQDGDEKFHNERILKKLLDVFQIIRN